MAKTNKKDKRIVINVGGVRHETWISTLEKIPGTRLSHLAALREADESYDKDSKEYFFDRHPMAFATILQYYRVGELHMDSTLCGNVMDDELEFWGLPEYEIESCCWSDYSKHREHRETLNLLDDNFSTPKDNWSPNASELRKKWWAFFEDPNSSRAAKIYAIISMSFVLLSICIFVLETHEWFQEKVGNYTTESTVVSTGDCCCRYDPPVGDYEPILAMKIIDYITVSFFTLEVLLRIALSPCKKQFFKQALNIIDILCLLPHYITIIIKAVDPGSSATTALKIIVVFRVIRILRIFKLMKHYGAFKILVYTIKVSSKELLLMVIFLFTGVLIFACIIYYAEPDNFRNIPLGFWWALVTMTTVGYGDKYPKKELGYFIGCLCVLCGVLTIAFTVPIVVNNFTLYYSHAQSRTKQPVQEKRKKTGCQVGVSSSSIPRVEFEPGEKPKNVDTQNNLNIRVSAQKTKQKSVESITDNAQADAELEEVETDVPSLDSSYETPHERETRHLMHGLANVSRRLIEERRRQVQMIHDRREHKRQQREDGRLTGMKTSCSTGDTPSAKPGTGGTNKAQNKVAGAESTKIW